MSNDADTFRIGRLTAHLIQDGFFHIPAETLIRLGRVKKEEVSLARLLLGFTCMVIREDNQVILIDTGIGEKPLEDEISEYQIQLPRQLQPGLLALGIQPEAVDVVILTHLHWDHAGGSTVLDDSGKAVPAFPNATYIVQKSEWEWALSEEGRDSGSYHPDDFIPLQDAGQLQFVDGEEEVYPGIQVEWTGGHCPGHQVVWIEDGGDTALYPADIIPTPQFLTLDRVLSYDHAPNQLVAVKQELIRRAVDFGATVVFIHVPKRRIGELYRDADGSIKLIRK